MKFIAKLISQYLLGVIGIILISSIPALFHKRYNFDPLSYFQNAGEVVSKNFTPSEWSFISHLRSSNICMT